MADRDNAAFEGDKALLSMAGWVISLQDNVSVNGGAANSYTVQNADTRRVAFIFVGGSDGDIRFAHNTIEGKADADSNDMPLPSAVYMILDARKGEEIGFYNTTGGAITVYVVELR